MVLAWWSLDFPFMKRYSKAHLKKYPHHKGRDIEITRKACRKYKAIPVSIMNFVEGTRLTPEKKARQKSPYNHLLKPKSGGIAFVLSAMGDHMTSILDVTIVYPKGGRNFWDFLCGRVQEVIVTVKTIPISEDIKGDYFGNSEFRIKFQGWLNNLWLNKDEHIGRLLTQADFILQQGAGLKDDSTCGIHFRNVDERTSINRRSNLV